MVDLQQKDLRLVLEYAEQLKQPLPGVALARQLLAVLQAQGRGQDGTQALVEGSQDFFSLALKSVQEELLEAWNTQLVPYLFRWNTFAGMTALPRIDWAPPGSADLTGLAEMMNKLVTSKIITPGAELEDFFRQIAGLPDRPEGVGEGPREIQPPGGGGGFFNYAAYGVKRRRPGPKANNETNQYQDELVTIYQKWAKDVENELLAAGENRADLIAIVDRRVKILEKRLLNVSKGKLSDAFKLGYKGPMDEAARKILTKAIKDNNESIQEKLIPWMRDRMEKHIDAGLATTKKEEREYLFGQIAIATMLDHQIGPVVRLGGLFWKVIFDGGKENNKRIDDKREKEGKPKRRVKWVLDPSV